MAVKSFFTHSIVLSFLLIFTNQTVLAQYDELKNNSSIPWIAEFSMDQSFSNCSDKNQQNILKLIKFYNDPANMEGANRDNWVINWIYQNAIDGQYDCYKDAELTQQISGADLFLLSASIDTVITFDPKTFKETIEIYRNELAPPTIKSLRTKQVIFYNQKSGNFETKLIAVAPLQDIDSQKEPVPLFWIKMNASFPNNFEIHSPNITWGALIDTKGFPLDFNVLEVVKNENNFDFKKQLQQHAFNLEKPIESAEGYGCGKFLNKKQVGNLYNSIDTIITFDPITFQETVEIAKYEIGPNDISHYRLVQEWYFDEKSKKLMNRLKAICPLYFIRDENGIIEYVKDGSPRFAKPLYFIRYN
jgi:Gliding motility associated protein GldN